MFSTNWIPGFNHKHRRVSFNIEQRDQSATKRRKITSSYVFEGCGSQAERGETYSGRGGDRCGGDSCETCKSVDDRRFRGFMVLSIPFQRFRPVKEQPPPHHPLQMLCNFMTCSLRRLHYTPVLQGTSAVLVRRLHHPAQPFRPRTKTSTRNIHNLRSTHRFPRHLRLGFWTEDGPIAFSNPAILYRSLRLLYQLLSHL